MAEIVHIKHKKPLTAKEFFIQWTLEHGESSCIFEMMDAYAKQCATL